PPPARSGRALPCAHPTACPRPRSHLLAEAVPASHTMCTNPAEAAPAERSEPEFAGDEHELDLGGALPDLEDLRVAVVASDEVFVHEAVAAVDLGGIAGVVHRCLAGDHLRDRGLLLERHPGAHPGRSEEH